MHGGATKASFAAGAVYALSRYGVKTADILIGVLSSVPTVAYFASRQYEYIKDIWQNEIGNKSIIHYQNLLTGKPVFDLPYLIQEIFRKKYPLDVKKIYRSPSLFTIPLFNYKSGKVELYSNKQKNFKRDFWKILQAAMTVHDLHLVQQSKFNKYVDADLDPFAIYRQHLIPHEYNAIVILNHKKLDFDIKKLIGLKFFLALQSKNFPLGVTQKLRIREKLTESGLKVFEEFQQRCRPILIQPPSKIYMGVGSIAARSNKKLRYFFDAGEEMVSKALIKGDLNIFAQRSQKIEERGLISIFN